MMPFPDDPDLPTPPASPFDPGETAEEDLWFLPGPGDPDEAPEVPFAPPLPRAAPAARAAPGELAAWRAAEAALAGDLARAALAFGALDDRLRRAGEGARQRLALLEAAAIGWHAGDRVPPDRIALWVALRLAGAQEDPQALARAAWAVRRLSGGPGPLEGAKPGEGDETGAALAAFLDRRDAPGTDLAGRLQDWRQAWEAGAQLHPFTRAARGQALWPLAGLSGPGAPAEVEAEVTAARLAATAGRGGALFLPRRLAGIRGASPGGSPEARLRHWLNAAEAAVLAALLHLDRIEAWRTRAGAALTSLSGRTPPRLVAVLADWPLVTAAMAETLTGASRAAVQRNLDRMNDAGLLREVTGQGRFRVWAAKI